jgi:hypothetical protein
MRLRLKSNYFGLTERQELAQIIVTIDEPLEFPEG